VGCRRFDTPCEHQALYSFLNYFLPTVRLIDRQGVGSKVRKVYDKPMRLMASPDLSEVVKTDLRRPSLAMVAV
jgi:hypothetical protein